MRKIVIVIFVILFQRGFTSEIIILNEKIYKDKKYDFESKKMILKDEKVALEYNYNTFNGLGDKLESDKISMDSKILKVSKINFKENKNIEILEEKIFIPEQDLYLIGLDLKNKKIKISNKFRYLKNDLQIGTRYGILELKNQNIFYNILKIWKINFLYGELKAQTKLNEFEVGKIDLNSSLIVIGDQKKLFFGKVSQKSQYNIDYKVTGLLGMFEEYKYESEIDLWVYGVNYNFKKGDLKMDFILGSMINGEKNKINFYNKNLKGNFPFNFKITRKSKKYKLDLDKPIFGNININYERKIYKSVVIGIDKNFPFVNGIKIKEVTEENAQNKITEKNKKSSSTSILNYLKSGSKIYFKIKF